MKYGKITRDRKEQVTLRYYLNEDGVGHDGLRPAMLVLPGGAYRMCSEDEAEPIALAYLSEGYQAFVLNYTVGGEGGLEAVLDDANWAMETIAESAAAWGLDSDRRSVIGFSAGGHLAAMLGTRGQRRPAALVLGYPCIQDPHVPGLCPFDLPDVDSQVDDLTPPAFLFAASDDPIVPVDALPFAKALNDHGKLFEMHIFHRGGHGFSLGKAHTAHGNMGAARPRVGSWFGLSVEWLNEVLDNFPLEEPSSTFNLPATFERYSVDIALRELWNNEACRELLAASVPELEQAATGAMADTILGISARMMATYMPEMLTEEKLNELDRKLAEIPVK